MKKPLAPLLCLLSSLGLNCQNETLLTAPEDDPNLVAMNSGKKGEVWAKGKVMTEPSPTIIDEFSFDARSRGDGGDISEVEASGRFKFKETRSPDTEFEVEVEAQGVVLCLQMIGDNQAKIGGRITFSSFEEGFPEGNDVIFSLTDNGKRDDSASQLLVAPAGAAEVYCAAGAPPAETEVEKGFIRVRVRMEEEGD